MHRIYVDLSHDRLLLWVAGMMEQHEMDSCVDSLRQRSRAFGSRPWSLLVDMRELSPSSRILGDALLEFERWSSRFGLICSAHVVADLLGELRRDMVVRTSGNTLQVARLSLIEAAEAWLDRQMSVLGRGTLAQRVATPALALA